MPRSAITLKAKALACVAQREHSRTELRRKLLDHLGRQARLAESMASAPPTATAAALRPDLVPSPALPVEQQVDALLDWLAGNDLLNAERFVETRISARAARFGNLRIRHELARHGLEPDAAAAQALAASELNRAQAVWTKRFGTPSPDAAGRAKQLRFLAARGFSAEVARRVVSGAGNDD